jgi:hypothetical protein
MKQKLTALFAERSRRSAVIIVSFAVLLLALWVSVDHYRSGCSALDAAYEEWVTAEKEAADAPRLQQRLAEVAAQVEAAERCLTAAEESPALRNKIVEMSRTCGCQMRRLEVTTAETMPWPTDAAKPQPAAEEAKKHPYQARTMLIRLTASGSMPQLDALFDTIREEGKLLRLETCRVRPEHKDGAQLIVADLELSVFGLAKSNR